MDKALQILREYIDERISFVTDDPEWRNKKESERLWDKFIEFIAAYLRAWEMRMRWISVKDRLPEPMTRVLVWTDNRMPHEGISYLKDGEWQTTYYSSLIQTINVSYWMPLPGPPEGWGECGEVTDA